MKTKLIAIAMSGAVLLSGTAAAAGLDFDPKFYVGGEVQGAKYQGSKKIETKDGNFERPDKKRLFSKSALGGSLILGSRLNEWFGVEAGATKAGAIKLKLADTEPSLTADSIAKVKSKNFYADLLGFIPVMDQVELIGSIGVGRLSSDLKGSMQEKAAGSVKENFKFKSHKTGVRLGAGVGVKLDDNISARLMVRHQQGNKIVKNVTSAGLGLFYQF